MTAIGAAAAEDALPAAGPAAWRRAIRDWLEANLPPAWRADAIAPAEPGLEELKAWEARMYRAGLAGVAWPKAYGGHGLTLREHLIVSQEIGRMPMPESVNSIGKELAGPILLAIGTEEQKKRFIPAILEMREIWCQGFSEPEAGSDLAGLRTRATHDGKVWRINGRKIWTSGGFRAQRCLLLARTGTLEDRHRGLALFVLRMDAPGVTVQRIRQIDGEAEFAEVFLDDVPVEEADALGSPDEGWQAAVRVLEIERATNRMYRAWRLENELRHLVAACRADPNLAPLLADPAYAQRLAQFRIEIEVLKRYVEGVVEDLAAGGAIGGRGSLIKLHWSEAHQRFAALALELLGQAALPPAPEVRAAQRRFRRIYLRARAETIYAGTSQIQLGIIADRILRLPRAA
ncbi:acyl-CoA dehydrogenase family protein [Caldovatus aquaticus]|uniref:Acyl-CoA dehydrogenase family protein n=1 Tax=Caldovatus aquaticus TaxID=2865671 RepID=A0ABS7F639_9PROT|nr:acyl-CoA dehydrogenase family protein [Caldovatus aquaticus]MBW8271034.1 acyl-CoA dehydrogenase family protein [Caldovatus aquaticus]